MNFCSLGKILKAEECPALSDYYRIIFIKLLFLEALSLEPETPNYSPVTHPAALLLTGKRTAKRMPLA